MDHSALRIAYHGVGVEVVGPAVAAVDGTYRIPLTLPDGLDVLTVRATDGFGQQRTASTRVVLDATPPTVVAALAADTGSSGTDGITSDPSVAGALGDNRGVSDDSRFWGPVPSGWIIGTVVHCALLDTVCHPVR